MIAEQVLAGEVVWERSLIDFVRSRRWFGSKAEDVAHARILDGVVVRSQPPLLVAAVAEVRFQTGTHHLYQLLLGLRPHEDGWQDEVIEATEEWVVYEALCDPALARELVHLMRGEATIRGEEAAVEFRPANLGGYGPDLQDARPLRCRAVEHVGRVRGGADPEGVPPAGARHQPRARGAALPHRARLLERAGARRAGTATRVA